MQQSGQLGAIRSKALQETVRKNGWDFKCNTPLDLAPKRSSGSKISNCNLPKSANSLFNPPKPSTCFSMDFPSIETYLGMIKWV